MKKLLLSLLALGVGIVVGCSVSSPPQPAKAETTQPTGISVVSSGVVDGDQYKQYEIVKDNETGSEYIVIRQTSNTSMVITPRLTTDFSYSSGVHTTVPVIQK